MDGVMSYRVTDLDLYSAENLTSLTAALEAQGLDVGHRAVRHSEADWYSRFQAVVGEPRDGPEPEVAAMLAAVEALDPAARAAWDGCSLRVFDIAYDCGTKPFYIRHDLSAGAVERLAAAGATLRFTLYTDSQTGQAEQDAAAPDL
jgi:hypothetical protein